MAYSSGTIMYASRPVLSGNNNTSDIRQQIWTTVAGSSISTYFSRRIQLLLLIITSNRRIIRYMYLALDFQGHIEARRCDPMPVARSGVPFISDWPPCYIMVKIN